MKPIPARRPARELEPSSYVGMVRRVIRAAGQRLAAADPEDLRLLLELHAELDRAVVEAVRGQRAAGSTWESIGAAAGTTRQAALMKWGPRL